MNAIESHGLTKYYGKARGIVDVSLSVEEGAFFGFIGPNGAGKSTFIRTVLGLITASSGTASVLGRDITADRKAVLSDVGYLPSETAFYSGMKVKDMLAFSAGLRGRDCAAAAAVLCERLELDPSRKIEELSLGNRKKAGIICAMQHDPKLYILDEPTSGLDPLMQREFYDILKERHAAGATVFLSSHILSEIGRYCSHAAVIREGRLLVSDRVSVLGHTGVKRVTLRAVTAFAPPTAARNVHRDGDDVTFLYDGKPEALLTALSAMRFDDITIADPDLEEVFMHYYMKEGE